MSCLFHVCLLTPHACSLYPQAFKRSTTKFWVRTSDVSAVKRIIIENMPVFVFNAENYSGDAQLINSGALQGSGSFR